MLLVACGFSIEHTSADIAQPVKPQSLFAMLECSVGLPRRSTRHTDPSTQCVRRGDTSWRAAQGDLYGLQKTTLEVKRDIPL